jgi:hypothetical protein
VLKLDWMAVDLLLYLWLVTVVGGLLYLAVRGTRRDLVLHLGVSAEIGLTAGAAACIGLWLMFGGWGPPRQLLAMALDPGAILRARGFAVDRWQPDVLSKERQLLINCCRADRSRSEWGVVAPGPLVFSHTSGADRSAGRPADNMEHRPCPYRENFWKTQGIPQFPVAALALRLRFPSALQALPSAWRQLRIEGCDRIGDAEEEDCPTR